jgi:hypothetical protein
MAHGKTLDLRAITRPEPQYVVRHQAERKEFRRGGRFFWRIVRVGIWSTHVNPSKDRTLAGKARRNARKAANR